VWRRHQRQHQRHDCIQTRCNMRSIVERHVGALRRIATQQHHLSTAWPHGAVYRLSTGRAYR
jgi:hypothetical protein